MLHLQEDINSIFSWSIKDSLSLNLSPHAIHHAIATPHLLPVTSHKDQFSSDLKWSHHYEYIITKDLKTLRLLRRQLTSSNCTI